MMQGSPWLYLAGPLVYVPSVYYGLSQGQGFAEATGLDEMFPNAVEGINQAAQSYVNTAFSIFGAQQPQKQQQQQQQLSQAGLDPVLLIALAGAAFILLK
jgi:hypothetical protein